MADDGGGDRRRALDVIRQNYAPAVGVNSMGIVVGAAGWINPFIAALLHSLSTVAVVLSSSRLIGYRDPSAAMRILPSSSGAETLPALPHEDHADRCADD